MRKMITMSIVGLAVASVAGIGTMSASAMQARNGNETAGNGYEAALETRADAVGLTGDELQARLETQTMQEVMAAQGVSEESYQAARREAAESRWVEHGTSEERIAERQAAQAERQASADGECDGDGTPNHDGSGGYGHGYSLNQ